MATKTKKTQRDNHSVRKVDFELRADMASDSDCHHLALLLSSMASLQLELGDFS